MLKGNVLPAYNQKIVHRLQTIYLFRVLTRNQKITAHWSFRIRIKDVGELDTLHQKISMGMDTDELKIQTRPPGREVGLFGIH